MKTSKPLQTALLLYVLVVLTPSMALAYSVLWDTSHGVADNGNYQPSGYYQTLAQHLGDNGFTVDTTADGFLVDDPAGYDVVVVCLPSAYYSAYTTAEVDRIVNFVNDGGGLLIMADQQNHPNANIQPIASEFGITLGPDDLQPFEVYSSQLDRSHPVFDGFGEDDQIFLYAATELSVSGPAFSIAQQEVTGKIIVAAAQHGRGRVVAIGDSTLWAVNPNIIDSYFYEANNPQFSVNTFAYLAIPEPGMLLLLGIGGLILLRNRRTARAEPPAGGKSL